MKTNFGKKENVAVERQNKKRIRLKQKSSRKSFRTGRILSRRSGFPESISEKAGRTSQNEFLFETEAAQRGIGRGMASESPEVKLKAKVPVGRFGGGVEGKRLNCWRAIKHLHLRMIGTKECKEKLERFLTCCKAWR